MHFGLFFNRLLANSGPDNWLVLEPVQKPLVVHTEDVGVSTDALDAAGVDPLGTLEFFHHVLLAEQLA